MSKPFTRSEPVAQSVAAEHTAQSTEMSQPKTNQPMDPQKPQTQSNGEPEPSLRGGDGCGGWCGGGRCCFCIPCPS